jgi:hypothetical protein
MAFVMVLSYSRHLFLRVYLNAAMGSFLHGRAASPSGVNNQQAVLRMELGLPQRHLRRRLH